MSKARHYIRKKTTKYSIEEIDTIVTLLHQNKPTKEIMSLTGVPEHIIHYYRKKTKGHLRSG